MGIDSEFLFGLVLRAPVVLFALTIHEFMHGYVAWKCGDETPRYQGRLTLNPMPHLDLLGTIMLFLPGSPIGWAKPVQVNPLNFGHPRRDDIFVSGAGVTANFLIAACLAILARSLILTGTVPETQFACLAWAMLGAAIFINFGLALFNLLPVPPLDGSHIVRNLLPAETAMQFSRLGPIFGLVLLVALLTGMLTPYLIWPLIYLMMFFAGPDAMQYLIQNMTQYRVLG